MHYAKYTKMRKNLLSRILQSSVVWTPVFKTVVCKLTDKIQSFLARYIPVPSFLNIEVSQKIKDQPLFRGNPDRGPFKNHHQDRN